MNRAFLAYVLLAVFFTLIPDTRLFAANADLKIALVLWRGETPAERGFKERLKELGYSVQYTTMDAGQDRKELGRIIRNDLKAHAESFDYVYTFGTTVSKAVQALLGDSVPHVFNIVAAPLRVGLVESMEFSGGNITGVTNAIPLSLQLEAATKVMRFKRLGFIFNPREKNSMAIRAKLSEMSDRFGFELVDLRSAPVRSALEKNLTKLKDGSIVVDAVYLPQDSFVLSNAALIGQALRNAGIKSIASVKTFIGNGALLGVVPDYRSLGRAAATIVERHRKGEKLENIPVQLPPTATLVISKSTSEALQIEIPAQLAKTAIFVD